jgi:CheY-like chemotaxis protein
MKKHFFVIDDDEDEIQMISAALNKMKADCKCTWANSGEQALQQLQYLQPDVIFVDYNMHGMNGIQCLQAIKDLPNCSHVPVILHSSLMTDQLCSKALRLGAYQCLQKPDTFDKLINILQPFTISKVSV